jgi:hypothetical protein
VVSAATQQKLKKYKGGHEIIRKKNMVGGSRSRFASKRNTRGGGQGGKKEKEKRKGRVEQFVASLIEG